MTMTLRHAFVVGLMLITPADAGAQQSFDDGDVIIAFQRAADQYAFQHRQVERLVGAADQARVGVELKAARAAAVEGALFTPLVANAFHRRIDFAMRAGDCARPSASSVSYEVPMVNASAAGTRPLDPCIARVLPKLPDELQYRRAGVALLVVDAHHEFVVDLMHGAFPDRDN
jgi:hypothetical protein